MSWLRIILAKMREKGQGTKQGKTSLRQIRYTSHRNCPIFCLPVPSCPPSPPFPPYFLLYTYLEAVEVKLKGGRRRKVLEVHVVGLAVLRVGHGHGRLLWVHQHG